MIEVVRNLFQIFEVISALILPGHANWKNLENRIYPLDFRIYLCYTIITKRKRNEKMDWKEKIVAGMKMIIEGCDNEGLWYGCKGCPFCVLYDTIIKDEESCYSTSDCWEEEGIFKTPLDTL